MLREAPSILALQPTLIPASDGSWIARAGDESPVCVGAMGPTEEAARERFAEALARLEKYAG
jgi:hypothetical protein